MRHGRVPVRVSFGRYALAEEGQRLGLHVHVSDDDFPTIWTPLTTLSGVVDGIPVAVQRFARKRGWDDHAAAALWPPLDLGLRVFAEGTIGRTMRDLFGSNDIEVGDDALDRSMRIQADDPRRVTAILLRPDVRAPLLGLAEQLGQVEWTDAGLRCGNSRYQKLTWSEHLPRMVAFLRAVRAAAATLPPAAELGPWVPALQALARGWRMRSWPTPLAAEGTLGDLSCGIFFRRVEHGRWAVELGAVIDRSMAHRLVVSPRSPRIAIDPFQLSEPLADPDVVSTMDDPFDRAFEVSGYQLTRHGLEQLLPPLARARMVALSSDFDVGVRDGVLVLRRGLEGIAPIHLRALLDAAADGARAVVPAMAQGYRGR